MKAGIKTIITGVGFFVLGAFIIPLAILLTLFFSDTKEVQFRIPGNTDIVIEEAGRYYLWNDYQTVFEGKSYNRSKTIPDGIEIKIRNKENNKLYDFISDSSISSSTGSSSKNSIVYIDFQSPVNITIEIVDGGEERIFSFSQSDFLKMFGLFVGGWCFSMFIGISGIGLTIYGVIKLIKSNKKSSQATSLSV